MKTGLCTDLVKIYKFRAKMWVELLTWQESFLTMKLNLTSMRYLLKNIRKQ